MNKLLAIAINTFKEAIRDRILYGFVFFAISLILFSLVLGELSFGEQVRCTLDLGLAGISLFSTLISIFLGISLLHKEIEKKTIYPILSKPVSRASFLLGKFFGLVLSLLALIGLMLAVFFPLIVMQGGEITLGLIFAIVLIFVETMLIISIAMFFTSFTSPFLSGIFCLGIFVAGRNANMIDQLASRESMDWIAPLLKAISTSLPNLYLFYPSGKMVESSWATIHAQFVSTGYMLSSISYGLAYTGLFLILAIVLLSRRDFV